MRAMAAFALNDVRNIRRDSLMLYIVLVPWLMVLLLRLVVVPLTAWLNQQFSFDLTAYYMLILSVFLLIQLPFLFGLVIGLLVLDERDDDTLTALRVTPMSLERYTSYRLGEVFLFSLVYILITAPLSGLMPLALMPSLVVVALLAAMVGPALTLALATFAGNKLEGLALMKGLGIILMGPLAAYFIASDWQLLMGVLPSYWPAKALWLASEGSTFWPHLLVGVAYHGALLAWLLRRFSARLAAG